MYRITGLIAVLSLRCFAGCSGLDDPTKNCRRRCTKAKDKVTEGDYETGIKYFESLEARYPWRFSRTGAAEIATLTTNLTSRPRIAARPFHPCLPTRTWITPITPGLVNFHGEKNFVTGFGDKDDLSDRDPRARSSPGAPRGCGTLSQQPLRRGCPHRMAYLFEAQAKYETRVARFCITAAMSRRSTAASTRWQLIRARLPPKTPSASWRCPQGHGHERYDEGHDAVLTELSNSRYLAEINSRRKPLSDDATVLVSLRD
jgi:outer membrane protein assembly factor BamD